MLILIYHDMIDYLVLRISMRSREQDFLNPVFQPLMIMRPRDHDY